MSHAEKKCAACGRSNTIPATVYYWMSPWFLWGLKALVEYLHTNNIV